MTDVASITPAAASARRKADRRREDGWVRNSFWLTPEAIDVLDGARNSMQLASREAAINAILARIGSDMFLQQEFLRTVE